MATPEPDRDGGVTVFAGALVGVFAGVGFTDGAAVGFAEGDGAVLGGACTTGPVTAVGVADGATEVGLGALVGAFVAAGFVAGVVGTTGPANGAELETTG